MEKTLVIFKPSAIQRDLVGEVLRRFEKKGLQLCGLKMTWLSDEIVSEHYSHLANKSFFQRVKDGMTITPVIISCWKGVDAINVVRNLTGSTNGRNAQPGTIRGDFSMSMQENIVHASDSIENARIELERFFKKEEIYDYKKSTIDFLYTNDEI